MKKDKELLISIIIPVYNVEKLLHRAVDSVLNQNYKNLEILLIDDGSTDDSGKLCDFYATYYSNVYVYHKENGGQSSARNLGIEKANGEFIGFVDSDDWIVGDMFSYLYNLIQLYDADVSSISSCQKHSFNFDTEHLVEYITLLENEEIVKNYMESTTKYGSGFSICNCLFKRKVLENVRFREGKIYEDIDFKFKVFKNARKYVKSNLIKYFYFQNLGSTSYNFFRMRDFQLLEACDVLCDLCRQTNNERMIYLGYVKKYRSIFSLLGKIAFLGYDNKISLMEISNIIKNLTTELRKKYLFLMTSPMSIDRKLMITLLCIHFKCLQIPLSIYKYFFKN